MNRQATSLSSDLAVAALAAARDVGSIKTGKSKSSRLDVYFFLSLDLVGSTRLKVSEEGKDGRWAAHYQFFYESCQTLVGSVIPGAKLWKFLGDEVLFYVRIQKPMDIRNAVKSAYASLIQIAGLIQSRTGDAASAKGTAWLAPIRSYDSLTKADAVFFDDLAEKLRAEDREISGAVRGQRDFLGPNIDAGFRLAQYTRREQLLLAPGLAYYLLDSGLDSSRLSVLDAVQLKGVAAGMPLPIVWYSEKDFEFAKDWFHYDERYGDELVRKLCNGEAESGDYLRVVQSRIANSGYFFSTIDLNRVIKSRR
jgi:hypothetical protein